MVTAVGSETLLPILDRWIRPWMEGEERYQCGEMEKARELERSQTESSRETH